MGRSRGTLTQKGRSGLASHALYATAPASYSTGPSVYLGASAAGLRAQQKRERRSTVTLMVTYTAVVMSVKAMSAG